MGKKGLGAAAVMMAISLSTAIACSGGGGSDVTTPTPPPPAPPPPPPPAPIASIRVDLTTATLAKGQVVTIVATAFDVSGSPLSGKTFAWSSDNANATVDLAGRVTGAKSGTANVTATAEGKSASAGVTVVQFASIHAGMLGTCALSESGRTYCAGSSQSSDLAKPVGGILRFSALTAGSEPEGSTVGDFCGLTADGTGYCWGANSTGQLGVGDVTARADPTPVSTQIKFRSISAGQHHTCGIATTGDTYCWGEGASGQIGNGALQNVLTPQRVSGANAFTQIASGAFQSCGLTSAGKVWCWGRNNLGQLGQGKAGDPQSAPSEVITDQIFVLIASRWNWTCGLTIDGTAYCWGDNTLGQLGFTGVEICDGDKPCATTPGKVNTTIKFTSLAMSQFATCASRVDNQIFCWGGDMQRQFGAAAPPSTCGVAGFAFGCTTTPIAGPSGFMSLSGSPRTFCGMSVDIIAYCWGGNNMKQLGNSSVSGQTATPVVFSIEPSSGGS